MMGTVVPACLLPFSASSVVAQINVGTILTTVIFGFSIDSASNRELYNIGVGRPQLSQLNGEYYPSPRLRKIQDGRTVGDDEYLVPNRGRRPWRRRRYMAPIRNSFCCRWCLPEAGETPAPLI